MMGLCSCGSGMWRRELKDARGIFCTFVCDKCERRKRAEFRPEIFTDARYEADEPIEEEWWHSIQSRSDKPRSIS